MKLLAKTFEGLEEVLAKEIEEIGGKNIKILTRAVAYEGDERIMYASNYMLRTALRILEIKKEFNVKDADDLYYKMLRLPWDQLIGVKDTFAVDATTSGEDFTHSKFTALKVKDAIVDKIRNVKGDRPSVNTLTPTYRVNIHIRGTRATLSMDTSGESLHLRGYRITAVDAPLNEVMAAGLIQLSGWAPSQKLIDPMCGSGTILIEAAQMALNIPPQRAERAFCFKKWRKFNSQLWEEVVNHYNSKTNRSYPISITGYDKNLRALKVTEQNIESAGLSDKISVAKQEFFKSDGTNGVTVMTNPPYDLRLKEDDIVKFYKNIGDKLKHDYTDCDAWVFSGNIDALKALGLRPSKKYNLMNGGIEAKFYKYEIYEGTKS